MSGHAWAHRRRAAAPEAVGHALRRPGRSLPQEVRAAMEPRFGFDFGKVRIHDDTAAHDAAKTVGASAYTLGSDIAFARGRYAPSTAGGGQLLAHELTHVVQQRGGGTIPGALTLGARDDPAERGAMQPVANGTVQLQDDEEKQKDPQWMTKALEDEQKAKRQQPGGPPGGKSEIGTFGFGWNFGSKINLSYAPPVLGEKVNLGFTHDRKGWQFDPLVKLRNALNPPSTDPRDKGGPYWPMQDHLRPVPGYGLSDPMRPQKKPLLNIPPIGPIGPIRSASVNFPPNQSSIPAAGTTALERMATMAFLYPTALVHVDGHAEEGGTPESDTSLSGARTEAVRAALVSLGVQASRIVVSGAASNRRVEVWFIVPASGRGP